MLTINEVLQKKEARNVLTLNENSAKQILKQYGVPVIGETVVMTEAEAVTVAEHVGYPVVVKGLGATLLHKTERNLVRLNLLNPIMVKHAAREIRLEAGDELEGFLIQPFLRGSREFVAGLFRDEVFGPVIMFGLGGVFTEALEDVSFRLAPLTKVDAELMIAEIHSQALLGNFRGEQVVDQKMIIDTLLGLSQLAIEHPEIAEVDINPLMADAEGRIHAVDALVVINKISKENNVQPPIDPQRIKHFFHPTSVAFIGASAQFQKWGYLLPLATLAGPYKGEIYLVNPKGEPIFNRTTYCTVNDIPGKVDLVVVTVPAEGVIDLIPQLKNKGVKNMLIITSGFREVGEKGSIMESQLIEEANKAGILIVGPNTMGICNPHIGLSVLPFPVMPRAGSTALVCQSGNMGLQFLAFAEQQNIGIRGFCGTGNESMTTITDYMAAFEFDSLTRIVMLYVESVKSGRRFFETARRVSCKKPIVLLKGGQSKTGKKAAASHTGAIASDARIFNAVCRQAGVVKVETSRTLLDVVAAFAALPIPKGNRVAIMTLGGGWGVLTADLCSNKGLIIPDLNQEIIGRIDKLLPAFWSRANPIDIVATFDISIPMFLLEELMKWDGCDAVINLGILGKRFFFKRIAAAANVDSLISSDSYGQLVQHSEQMESKYIEHIVSLMEMYQKPIIGVSLYDEEKDRTVYPVGDSVYKGLFYPTPARSVEVLSKMCEYNCFRQRQTADYPG